MEYLTAMFSVKASCDSALKIWLSGKQGEEGEEGEEGVSWVRLSPSTHAREMWWLPGLAGSQAEGAEMRILSNVGWVWQAFLLNPLFEPV